MVTIDKTLAKADAALEIILKHDEKNSDSSFKQVLDEIIDKWRNLE